MTIPPTKSTETLGEKLRKIADQLKEESDLQIRVTSRILGASAQIAENQDRLIDEVADMIEEDLHLKNNEHLINTYTVESLKKQFRTLVEATSHFGLKTNKWADLVSKLNNSSEQNETSAKHIKTSTPDRLETIENEIRILRTQTSQILVLLQRLIAVVEP